MMSRRYP